MSQLNFFVILFFVLVVKLKFVEEMVLKFLEIRLYELHPLFVINTKIFSFL
jgi:hypothetical protein